MEGVRKALVHGSAYPIDGVGMESEIGAETHSWHGLVVVGPRQLRNGLVVDDDIFGRHCERIRIAGAVEDSGTGRIDSCSVCCETQREADLVVNTGIKHIAILDARAIAGDATDIVFGGSAGVVDSYARNACDAVSLLALDCTQIGSVIAVGYGGQINKCRCNGVRAKSAYGNLGGSEEAVGERNIGTACCRLLA